jgi:hypothetical protein
MAVNILSGGINGVSSGAVLHNNEIYTIQASVQNATGANQTIHINYAIKRASSTISSGTYKSNQFINNNQTINYNGQGIAFNTTNFGTFELQLIVTDQASGAQLAQRTFTNVGTIQDVFQDIHISTDVQSTSNENFTFTIAFDSRAPSGAQRRVAQTDAAFTPQQISTFTSQLTPNEHGTWTISVTVLDGFNVVATRQATAVR